MKAILISISGLLLAACSETTQRPTDTSRAAFESYVAALNNGDVAEAASYYDTQEGFHWIERGGVQYETGGEAANSLLALQSSGGRSEMTLNDIRVSELTKDSSLISTHFDFVMRSVAGETQFAFDGWMTVGMVKRDGVWKIAGGQTGPGKTGE